MIAARGKRRQETGPRQETCVSRAGQVEEGRSGREAGSLSGSSENGHNFRVRNGIYDGQSQFDSCKYGNKPRDVARQSHDQAYDVKRVRKKPACLKKPASR